MSKFKKSKKHSRGSNDKKKVSYSRNNLITKLQPNAQGISGVTRNLIKNFLEWQYHSKYKHYLKPGDDEYVYFIDNNGREQKTRIGKVLARADNEIGQEILKRYQQERSITKEENVNLQRTVDRVEEAIKSKVPENPLERVIGSYDLSSATFIRNGKTVPVELVISQDPIDMTLKSTTQPWESRSCERIGGAYGNPASTQCGFASDIENNNAIAIMKDKNTKEWLGRFMVRWCELEDGNVEARIELLYSVTLPDSVKKKARQVLEAKLTEALLYEKPNEQCCVKYKYHGYSDVGSPSSGKVCYGDACLDGITLDIQGGNVCLFLDQDAYDRSNAEYKYLVVELFDTGSVTYYLDESAEYIFERNIHDENMAIGIHGIRDAFEKMVEYYSGRPISIKDGLLQYIEVFRGGRLHALNLDEAYKGFTDDSNYITPQTNFFIALYNNIPLTEAEFWERSYPSNPQIVLEDHVKLRYSRDVRRGTLDHDDLYEITMGAYKGKWLRKQASRYQGGASEYDAEIIELDTEDDIKKFLEKEFQGEYSEY